MKTSTAKIILALGVYCLGSYKWYETKQIQNDQYTSWVESLDKIDSLNSQGRIIEARNYHDALVSSIESYDFSNWRCIDQERVKGIKDRLGRTNSHSNFTGLLAKN